MSRILFTLATVLAVTGCASRVCNNFIYDVTKADPVSVDLLGSQFTISKGPVTRAGTCMEISDRVFKVSLDGREFYLSVFDENSFKPRRLRTLVFSMKGKDVVPYSRNNHCREDMASASDRIIEQITSQ
jgi:hypothetical protein